MRNRKTNFRTVTAVATIALLSACSSATKRPESPSAPAPVARANEGLRLTPKDLVGAESSVEISYAIGHEQRRLVALQSSGSAEASSYVGKELLRGGAINPDRYERFLASAQAFVRDHGGREPASVPSPAATPSLPDCAAPFLIQVRNSGGSWFLQGCRAREHELGASVGRLIHEGELLVFTKN